MTRMDNNTTNRLVRECIFTSLMQLMEKKDFQKITVTEITSRAGVSRMAYYRNYTSKEDILIEYLDELFEQYLSEVEQMENLDAYQFAYKFFSYFRGQKTLLINLRRAHLSDIMLNRFDKYLRSTIEKIFSPQGTEEISQYQIYFWAGGLYRVLLAWIENDFLDSDEKLANIVRKFSISLKSLD